jgi:hypothetical protein
MNMMRFKSAASERSAMKYYLAGIIAVLLYVLPQVILGQDSYVIILDNLDSPLVYRTVLVHSGQVFEPASSIEQIMNGLPRRCLDSAFTVITWLFMASKPYASYIFNKLLVHIFAFTGMWLLLRKHFLRKSSELTAVFGSSLCFAFLPFYSIFGLTVAGQPLLLYSFLNFYKRQVHWTDYFILGSFPFYSSVYQSGIFILLLFCAVCLYDLLKCRRINRGLVLGTGVLALGYVIVEHNLIYLMFFNGDFVSHRAAWSVAEHSYGIFKAVRESITDLIFGHYHASSLHTLIVVAAISVLAIAVMKKQVSDSRNMKLLAVLLLAATAVAVLYGFYRWVGLASFKQHVAIFRMFNFSRLNWFHPLLWYLVFAIVLSYVLKFRYGRVIAAILVAFQVSYLLVLSNLIFSHFNILDSQVRANEAAINAGILADGIVGRKSEEISYRQFFSEPLFDEIAAYIGRPKCDYRIINIGLYPSIAQYNGFYTLDSYQFNYPLQYKEEFRRIIAPELAKSEKWRKYFDSWGSRCYVFAAELENEPFAIIKNREIRISDLNLDTSALKEMGGEYVFSAVEIGNAAENNMTLQKVFERDVSPWRIYLYGVN